MNINTVAQSINRLRKRIICGKWLSCLQDPKQSLRSAALGVFLMVSSVTAMAQSSFCVRSGAPQTGTGADWSNAFPALPQTLVRGATYYVADGSYPAYTFDDAASASQLITIKKATASDHGTDTGWDNAYGDEQAIFSAWIITSNDWVFDGQKRAGWTSGHGFVVTNTTGQIIEARNANNLTFRYVEGRGDRNVKASVFYAAQYAGNNHRFQYCYFADVFGVHFYWINGSNILIEHSYMAANKSTAEWHSESIQARTTRDMTVRYCVFKNCEGTGVIVDGTGGGTNWNIYGNLFDGCSVGHGTVSDNTQGNLTNVKFYNNTIVNMPVAGFVLQTNTGNEAKNNVYWNCPWISFSSMASSYNYHSKCIFPYAYQPGTGDAPLRDTGNGMGSTVQTDPFVGSATGDYRLAGPLTGYSGLTLLSPYNLDGFGNTRGGDGTWDRGAYEYGGTAVAPPLPPAPPNPPTGVRVQ